MTIRDIIGNDGRIFIKSEWNQISNDWPCLSYSKSSVGEFMRQNFEPDRHILIYVGVTDLNNLIDEAFQSSLISAVQVEPNLSLSSEKMVSPHVWENSLERYGERWKSAFPVTWSANFIGPPYPLAHQLIENAYNALGNPRNWGQVVEVEEENEKTNVMNLEVIDCPLTYTKLVKKYMNLRKSFSEETPEYINQEATRMAELIVNRVDTSENSYLRKNPIRTSPQFTEIYPILVQKLINQADMCALCGGEMEYNGTNPMLKPSPDRIDSANKSYESSNLQVTHLACNLAKNENSEENFSDWLNLVRDVQFVG